MKRRKMLLLVTFLGATLFTYAQDTTLESMHPLWMMNSAIVCAGFGFIVYLVLSILLFYKAKKERGRLIFGGFTSYYAFAALYYVLRNDAIHIDNGDPFSFAVISSGAFVIALYLIFPLEVLLPPKLQKKWMIPILFIPVVLMNVVWVSLRESGMKVFRLDDAQAILTELNDASVILRLNSFCFIVLFFIASIIFMIWAHNRYMTDKVLRIYAYATIPIMLTYVLIVFYGLTRLLYMINMSYTYCFSAYITYLLLSSSKIVERGKNTQSVEAEIKRGTGTSNEMKQYELQLLRQLDKLMETDKLYRSSELSLPELARLLGTNRTKLSEIIRFKGFTNFSAYLNSYRLEEFMHIMSINGADKISDAASQAGFGCKASLYRCFISVYGVSPSEYLKNQVPK